MTKKQIKEWRKRLVYLMLLQFTGLNEKQNRKLRKLLKGNVNSEIDYYMRLLPKKERKQLGLTASANIQLADYGSNLLASDL